MSVFADCTRTSQPDPEDRPVNHPANEIPSTVRDRLRGTGQPEPAPAGPEHRWRATGGNGTATIVSRIGGPTFAVSRHGEPAIGLAEMVAAALNECPWLTETRVDVPEVTP